jgi:cytochrome c biogenesis protein CcmG/thiol:disulfide interchange protein DsbE
MRTTRTDLITLFVLAATWAAAPADAQTPERPTQHKLWSGDLTGNGRAEVITWDNKSRQLTVWDYSAATPKQLTSHPEPLNPTAVLIADLDGDGTSELIIAEGLSGYNTPGEPQVNIRLNVYQPLSDSGWTATEIFSAASERPAVTSLELLNMDDDPELELLFGYMASRYQTHLAVADRSSGSWQVEMVDDVRMGMHVSGGDVLGDGRTRIVVGRPYGDYSDPPEDTIPLGDAFVLDGNTRVQLPVFRGVSAVAVADVDGDDMPEIIVGDGWHRDYGKVARTRIAVIRKADDGWEYELIEDIPVSIRVEHIAVVDLDTDGSDEIVVWAARNAMFEGRVRLYRNSPDGWQGVSLADSVSAFAIADLGGDGRPQVVFAGPEPRAQTLSLNTIAWDAELAKEVLTNKADPASLVGQPAPEIEGATWIGGENVSLSELRGKVVLIDFWATWCGPCVDAFPTLKNWLTEYGPQGFEIIGMTNHSSQTTADVEKFLARRPLPWVVPVDPSNRTHLAYGTGNLPHQVLIDRDGIVHAFYTGAGETLDKVEQDIRLLLAR